MTQWEVIFLDVMRGLIVVLGSMTIVMSVLIVVRLFKMERERRARMAPPAPRVACGDCRGRGAISYEVQRDGALVKGVMLCHSCKGSGRR